MDQPLRLIGYARVSTEEQGDEGVSLGAQRARLEAYATAKQVELVDVLEETGSARSVTSRPGLVTVLRRLELGEADGLLIAKLDRLTRSMRDLVALISGPFRADRDRKLELVSVAESIDTSSATGRMMLHLLATVGQWEREVNAERTSEALQHLLKQGVRMGRAPFGLRANTEARDAKGHASWDVVPTELETVRMILAAREQGQNLSQIARLMNAAGRMPRCGRPWSARQVKSVLDHGPKVIAHADRLAKPTVVRALEATARLAARQEHLFNPAGFHR